MKHLRKIILIALILIMPAAASAIQITVGTDAVRSVDQAQYEGMMNVYFQMDITKSSAFIIAYSSSSDANIIDGSYRHYIGKYHDGMYIEGGATFVMLDEGEDDEEIGGFAQFGYETSPAEHFVVGVGARMIFGYDHPHTNEKDPIFLPVINFGFAF
ncbi:MAG: hypothetical protein GY714_22855 [Desulfobacterales bacterium]|nr:hypothetical protein [Desulfobacterales bacterium]MCP4162261.1 hypothetical protein [Deltaproteobacteria bacterium]